MKRLGWPKGAADQLPALCQTAMDAYLPFMAKLRKETQRLSKLPKTNSKVLAEADFLDIVRTKMGGVLSFVENWYGRVHARVSNWEGWNGDLTSYAFRPDHKDFQKQGAGWSTAYCHSPRLWTQLMERIAVYEG